MTIGSSNKADRSEFFRGADVWEFMALIFTEFTKLPEPMGVGDVLAVPREKIVDSPNDSHSNVQGVPNFGFRHVAPIKIELGKRKTWLGYGECAEGRCAFQAQ